MKTSIYPIKLVSEVKVYESMGVSTFSIKFYRDLVKKYGRKMVGNCLADYRKEKIKNEKTN